VKECKNILQENEVQKQARVTILIFAKADFKLVVVIREKEGHLVLIKEKILQDEIYICAPNV
jgi:hypothetical protein